MDFAPQVLIAAVATAAASTYFLRQRSIPSALDAKAGKLLEFFHNPDVFLQSKLSLAEAALEKYEIDDAEDLSLLFKNSRNAKTFLSEMEPLVKAKKKPTFKDFSDSIISLLPPEEEESQKEVSLNLLGSLDLAVEPTPAKSDQPTILSTPAPHHPLENDSSMVSPPEVVSLQARVAELEMALAEKQKGASELVQSPSPSVSISFQELQDFRKNILDTMRKEREEEQKQLGNVRMQREEGKKVVSKFLAKKVKPSVKPRPMLQFLPSFI